MALDRERILDEALVLVDERGVEGCTLRALGDALGVSAMAIYRHYDNKSAVIDALADRLLLSIQRPDLQATASADELILAYAHRAREALLAHPNLVPVVVARPLTRLDPQGDLLRMLDVFRLAGFPEDRVLDSALALYTAGYGLVLYETVRARYDREQGTSYHDDRRQLLDTLLAEPGTPPSLVGLVEAAMSERLGEMVFDAAMRALYDGLKRQAGILP